MAFDVVKGRQVVVRKLMEVMAERVRSEIPDKGLFRGFCLGLEYPGYDHTGRLYIQFSKERGCILRASAVVSGTDMEISNYLLAGSRAECLAWLEDDTHLPQLMEIYDHLMEKANDR